MSDTMSRHLASLEREDSEQSRHLASLEREASERHDVQALGQSREGG